MRFSSASCTTGSVLTLTGCTPGPRMQVFEPTVQLVFPPDTLDSIAVLSSWHVEPELCEWKKVVLLAKKNYHYIFENGI